MKKNYLLVLAFCFFAITSFAAQPKGKAVRLSKERIANLQMRSNPASALRATASDVILSEDFSKFTKGSEAAPDATDIGDCGNADEIPSQYTQTPGWWGYGVYQAGGVAYLGIDCEDYLGWLETPMMGFDGETVTVSLRVKSTGSADYINVVVIDYEVEAIIDENWEEIDGTWKTYTLTFENVTGDDLAFAFVTDEQECFIDDIEFSIGGGGTTNPSGTVFFETFGNNGPTSNPRARIEEYDDYDNGLPITFSVSTTDYPDIRATSSINTHVWFPAGKATDLVISNIPAAGYSDLALSFDVATNNVASANLNKIIVEVNDAAITVPSATFDKVNTYINSGKISISNADVIKLRFYYTAENNPTNYGYRLDNIKITGTPPAGIKNPSVNDVNFYVSGKTLSANNLATGAVIEVYNLLGSKVQTSVFTGNAIELNLAKGVYIVRSGKYSQKIIF